METSTIWWLFSGAFVALELITGTFYLLMFALGLATAAVCAHIGLGITAQMLIGALVGGGAVVGWHVKRSARNIASATSDSNADVHIDIGSVVQVGHWDASGATLVIHRGASWSARLIQQSSRDEALSKIGSHRIVAVEGNTLVLEPLTT